jgi:hypothetical protein
LRAAFFGRVGFRDPGVFYREQRVLNATSALGLLADLRELVNGTVRRSPGLTVQERIANAATTLRLPRSRVADWWYGEVRRVEAFEAYKIERHALAARQSEIARMERQLDALRAELADLAPHPSIRPGAALRLARRARARIRGAAPA